MNEGCKGMILFFLKNKGAFLEDFVYDGCEDRSQGGKKVYETFFY